MKKISFLAVMAFAAMTFVGCGNSTPKADLQNDIDTLSYAFGIEQSQGLRPYLQQMDIDTTYIDDFVKGLAVGAKSGDDKKAAAYNMGISIGQQLNNMKKGFGNQVFEGDSTKELSMKNLVAGFVAGATGKDVKITPEQARELSQTIVENIQSKRAEEKFAKEKKAADDFMAANAKKEGVQKLGKGVQYKVVKEGNGATPSKDATVTINYEGKTIAGKTFDKRDGAKMHVSGVIPGFTEALTHMPIGSKWEVYIPYSAAYGHRQAGQDITPFSDLIFTIELLGAEEPKKEEAAAAPAAPAAPTVK